MTTRRRQRFRAARWVVFGAAFFGILATSANPSARKAPPVYRVVFSATLEKRWTYSSQVTNDSCTETTHRSRRWQIRVTSDTATRVALLRHVNGRVEIRPARLAGLTATILGLGDSTLNRCGREFEHAACPRLEGSLNGLVVSVSNPRSGELRFGRLPYRPPLAWCGSEPDDVAAVVPALERATGGFRQALVTRRAACITARGAYSGRTTLPWSAPDAGFVDERVEWQATFARGDSKRQLQTCRRLAREAA